jgi:homoserine trans-succinylase
MTPARLATDLVPIKTPDDRPARAVFERKGVVAMGGAKAVGRHIRPWHTRTRATYPLALSQGR